MPARPHSVRAGRNIIRFVRIVLLSGEIFKIFAKVKSAKKYRKYKEFRNFLEQIKTPVKKFFRFFMFLTGVFCFMIA